MARDMTTVQFRAALRRNGFRQIMMWAEHPDVPGVSFGLRFYTTGKLAKRESIAHLIKSRDAELRKRNPLMADAVREIA